MRGNGKKANLVRDKLFVEGKEYKSHDEQVKYGSAEERKLSILSWNVECLKTCLDDADELLRDFDIIFCCET